MKCSEFHQEYENVIEIRCLGFKQVLDKVKKFAYAIAYAKNSRTLCRTQIDICADWCLGGSYCKKIFNLERSTLRSFPGTPPFSLNASVGKPKTDQILPFNLVCQNRSCSTFNRPYLHQSHNNQPAQIADLLLLLFLRNPKKKHFRQPAKNGNHHG